MDGRPNPEVLLKRVKEEEHDKTGGKLKIYLGAAPGVGKTHTMLEDAMALREKGIDVVIGIAESHGRSEINALLKGFEILPRKVIEYRGQKLEEFDLDAAIARNPQLILVDEMAHTNAPGSRHNKRWQDIKELMDCKIDVYTTLNVQHIESLNDSVSHIIHAGVKETVPDFMLDKADTIELVDLPPEELLKRLQDGKVYYPERAEVAQRNFFRKGNLIALRELALRTTAEHVGTEVLLYRKGEKIQHIWPTKEKILVCVGPGPESIKLIRAACRTATNMKVPWLAVFVNTPAIQASVENHNSAILNLRLAEQLGAETRELIGSNITKEILSFAREQNVTQIMVWKHIQPWWQSLFGHHLADEIVRASGEIDVYIMTGTLDNTGTKKVIRTRKVQPWFIYFISVATITAATIINYFVSEYMHSATVVMIYVLAVMSVSMFGKMGPAILSSILSVLAYDYFFVPSFNKIVITDISYLASLFLLLLVTQLISHLIIVTRAQAQAAQHIENQMSALYNLSRRLSNTRGVGKLLNTGMEYLAELFNSQFMALIPQNSVLAPQNKNDELDDKELGVAQWVYEMGQKAGLGTDTLPFSNAIYIPLLASQGAIGVLRVQPKTSHLFTPEQMHLLEACANQIALALEVDRMQEQTRKTELQSESNRVRNALLQSIAHDLQAPLVSIMAACSSEIELAKELTPAQISKLAKTIYLESEQLSRLINNLLQISDFESDNIHLQKQVLPFNDVLKTVLRNCAKKLAKREVNLKVDNDLPAAAYDPVFMQEVLMNLIDNAVKFTPPESVIDIIVKKDFNYLLVCVEDRGPGIMEEEVDKLFEKFYRGRLIKSERGLGLGLALCHYIIRAHGGRIWAHNREEGGASFCFTLPIEEKAR